jgi:hypothetical protein
MKEKALVLIGLHSRKWLSEKMGINPITIDKRIKCGDWKISEISRLNELYESEKINL